MDFKNWITVLIKKIQKSRMLYTGLYLEKILYLVKPNPQRLKTIYFIYYKILLSKIFIKCLEEQEYPVYVINLDRDGKRMESFNLRAKKLGIRYKRIRALDAQESGFSFKPYEHLIGEKFYGNKIFPRGSVASFLSHRKAWLAFLDTRQTIALICEDDALLLGPLPKSAAEFQCPKNADIIFVNNRMCEAFYNKKYFDTCSRDKPNYYRIYEALMNICKEKIYLGGPGLDGYLVTRKGAQRLLKLYDEIKYSMNNDWFVVLNSLNKENRDAYLNAEGSGRMNKISLPDGPCLESYVMLPPLVDLGDFETSVQMLNPLTHVTREKMFFN